MARTTLGLYGSTVRPVRITASAPAASAARMIVPRLPGSRTSSQIATSRGAAANTSRIDVGVWRATATMPCGVHRVGHRVEHGLGREDDLHAGVPGGVAQIRMALERGRRREHLDDRVGPVRERLTRGLRTFEQEEPGLLPRAALGQLRDGADAGRARVLEHEFSVRLPSHPLLPRPAAPFAYEQGKRTRVPTERDALRYARTRRIDGCRCYAVFGALTSLGSAPLAVSTSEANVAGSLTASSASMRRSTCTPARPRPWMKRLYVRPF